HGESVGVPGKAQRRRRLGELEGLEQAILVQLLVLARDGAGQHGFEPLAPEVALEADIDEADGVVLAHWVSSGPPPGPFVLGCDDSRTTRVQGRRRTPVARSPLIMAIS